VQTPKKIKRVTETFENSKLFLGRTREVVIEDDGLPENPYAEHGMPASTSQPLQGLHTGPPSQVQEEQNKEFVLEDHIKFTSISTTEIDNQNHARSIDNTCQRYQPMTASSWPGARISGICEGYRARNPQSEAPKKQENTL